MRRVHVARRLQAPIAALGVRHVDVAHQLWSHPSMLSAFLNERRELSSDFEKRITEAVDLLEEAEEAARKTRKQVLEGHGA